MLYCAISTVRSPIDSTFASSVSLEVRGKWSPLTSTLINQINLFDSLVRCFHH